MRSHLSPIIRHEKFCKNEHYYSSNTFCVENVLFFPQYYLACNRFNSFKVLALKHFLNALVLLSYITNTNKFNVLIAK